MHKVTVITYGQTVEGRKSCSSGAEILNGACRTKIPEGKIKPHVRSCIKETGLPHNILIWWTTNVNERRAGYGKRITELEEQSKSGTPEAPQKVTTFKLTDSQASLVDRLLRFPIDRRTGIIPGLPSDFMAEMRRVGSGVFHANINEGEDDTCRIAADTIGHLTNSTCTSPNYEDGSEMPTLKRQRTKSPVLDPIMPNLMPCSPAFSPLPSEYDRLYDHPCEEECAGCARRSILIMGIMQSLKEGQDGEVAYYGKPETRCAKCYFLHERILQYAVVKESTDYSNEYHVHALSRVLQVHRGI